MMIDVAELIESATAAGLVLEPAGEYLRITGDPVPEDILDELRASKPAILEHLHAQAERQRDAAATEAWERLRVLHLRCGCPDGWHTQAVDMAEAAASWHWLHARDSGDNGAFVGALATWEHEAARAIRQAASRRARR